MLPCFFGGEGGDSEGRCLLRLSRRQRLQADLDRRLFARLYGELLSGGLEPRLGDLQGVVPFGHAKFHRFSVVGSGDSSLPVVNRDRGARFVDLENESGRRNVDGHHYAETGTFIANAGQKAVALR